MKNTVRAGVAALAFMGLVAQPMVANAGAWPCEPAATAGNATVPLLWGIGFETMVFLIGLALLLFFTKRKVWNKVEH
jgi:hypothetical protein